MIEYIERETALAFLKDDREVCADSKVELKYIRSDIRSIPAADVRPVVRGKWEEMFDSDGYPARSHWLCCSICGHVAPFGRMSDTESRTNFCPSCGADMREVN